MCVFESIDQLEPSNGSLNIKRSRLAEPMQAGWPGKVSRQASGKPASSNKCQVGREKVALVSAATVAACFSRRVAVVYSVEIIIQTG